MSGWQRIGVILTALWIFAVVGYGIYERSQVPIRIFGEETINPHEPYYVESSLLFVNISSRNHDTAAFEKAIAQIYDAKTVEERQSLQAKIDSAIVPVYETSPNGFFWLCLLTPIVSLWVLSYLVIFLTKWVGSGFTIKKDK